MLLKSHSEIVKISHKQYIENFNNYVLNSIDADYFEGLYPEFNELSKATKLQMVMKDLRKDYNTSNQLKNFPNEIDRLANHLRAVPGSLDLPVYNLPVLEAIAQIHEIDVEDIPGSYEWSLQYKWHRRVAERLLTLEYEFNN